jgi:hypothetical protein
MISRRWVPFSIATNSISSRSYTCPGSRRIRLAINIISSRSYTCPSSRRTRLFFRPRPGSSARNSARRGIGASWGEGIGSENENGYEGRNGYESRNECENENESMDMRVEMSVYG